MMSDSQTIAPRQVLKYSGCARDVTLKADRPNEARGRSQSWTQPMNGATGTPAMATRLPRAMGAPLRRPLETAA